MRWCAYVVGQLATAIARATLRSAATRCGMPEARVCVFSSLLASSDEASLVGVEGKRRGRVPMSPADPDVALAFWQRCAGYYAFAELARRRDLTHDNWRPARTEAIASMCAELQRFARSSSR
jgi:hypothetical protein